MSEQACRGSDTSCSGAGTHRKLRSFVRGIADPKPRCSQAKVWIAGSVPAVWGEATSRGRIVTAMVIATALGMLMLALFGLHEHAYLLKDAFLKGSTASPSGNAAGDTTNLYNDIDGLSTDSLYLLTPTVTLAGAVGGIFWAAGHRRGPSIMGGAIAAGVLGAGIKVIVS